jgi:hypothetical protein
MSRRATPLSGREPLRWLPASRGSHCGQEGRRCSRDRCLFHRRSRCRDATGRRGPAQVRAGARAQALRWRRSRLVPPAGRQVEPGQRDPDSTAGPWRAAASPPPSRRRPAASPSRAPVPPRLPPKEPNPPARRHPDLAGWVRDQRRRPVPAWHRVGAVRQAASRRPDRQAPRAEAAARVSGRWRQGGSPAAGRGPPSPARRRPLSPAAPPVCSAVAPACPRRRHWAWSGNAGGAVSARGTRAGPIDGAGLR